MLAQGNESDTDGTIVGFKINAVLTGTLTIGGAAFAAGSNDTVTAAQSAEWAPLQDQNGLFSVFTAQVVDNDGKLSPAQATAQIMVNPVNDPPRVTVNTNTVVTEAGGTEISLSQFNVADVDDDLSELTLTINSLPQFGTLSQENSSITILSGTAFNANDLFSPGFFSGAPAANNLFYAHDGSEMPATDSFTFTLTDGGEDNAVPVTGTVTISITPVDDLVQIVNLSGDQLNYSLSSPATLVDQNLDAQIIDVDSSNLNELVLDVRSSRADVNDPTGINDVYQFSGTGISSDRTTKGTPVLINNVNIGVFT